MIRVIYHWQVEPEHMDDFADAWRVATRAIHARTPGALGSFCLEKFTDPGDVLTVALWRSEREWRDFIGTAATGPMAAIHQIGKLISTTPYYQVGVETASDSQ